MNKVAYITGYLAKLADLIPGGKADDKDVEELAAKHEEDPKQIEEQKQKGLEVEQEHTDKPEVAGEIAEDHLEEFPDYYDRLGSMEEEAKAEKEQDLGDPGPEDTQKILDYIMSQPDLDDETLHQLYMSLGVDPEEGEEIVYAALQRAMSGEQITPQTPVEEQEAEEKEND